MVKKATLPSNNFLASIQKTPITWDLAFFLFLLAAGFFIGLSKGKNILKSAIVSAYIALAIESAMPITTIASLTKLKNVWVTVLITVLFFLLAYFVVNRHFQNGRKGSFIEILLLSVIFALFVVAAMLQTNMVAPTELSPLLQKIFIDQLLPAYAIIPLIAVFLL